MMPLRLRRSIDVESDSTNKGGGGQTASGGIPRPVTPSKDPSTPRALGPKTPDHKLTPFRDARKKLPSISAKQRLKELDWDVRGRGNIKTHSNHPSISTRSSSLMPPGTSTNALDLLPTTELLKTPSAPALSSTEDDTAGGGSADLFTPPSHDPPYAPSLTSTISSGSRNRDRVLGLQGNQNKLSTRLPTGSKLFLPTKVNDVLPFGTGHPFSAWALDDEGNGATQELKPEREPHGRWELLPRPRGIQGQKRIWLDPNGRRVGGVYRVGWERDVLDLEARIHESMWEMAGESHIFTKFADDDQPRTILDLGTGSGLWPISLALEWPDSTFIGVDIVPCQTDLKVLADAERKSRSTSQGTATGQGIWESIEKRITWQRADLMETLPFDSGVFDMVHMRFIGLGVPESRWGDLLEEAIRVLKPGGTLEIVEMSYTLPPSAPMSLRNSFNSVLLADLVRPLPILPLRFHLSSSSSLVSSTGIKPIFEQDITDPTCSLSEAVDIWVKSALDYKGTSLMRTEKTKRSSMIDECLRELANADADKWNVPDPQTTLTGQSGLSLWAWDIKRK